MQVLCFTTAEVLTFSCLPVDIGSKFHSFCNDRPFEQGSFYGGVSGAYMLMEAFP